MLDFAQARRMMVDGQIRTSDVTDRAITTAMLEVPRERFAPDGKAALAYLDLDLPLKGAGSSARCMLKPVVLAKLLQAAEIDASDRALIVGAGTGYSAAVLARLAASVVALEEDESLAAIAKNALAGLGVTNVAVVTGALTEGYAKDAPYNVILIEGGVERIPSALRDQLADGGRLVCVQQTGPAGKAMLYRRSGEAFSGLPIFDASAPVLADFRVPRTFVF